jgi:segregation and condensation protein B
LDISDLSHELVAAEPSIAEMIAAELDATADGIADTSAEIHAEMLAGALDEGTAENDATSEITIAAAAEAEAEGFDIDAELGEASEADRPAEQMEFAALEEELGENDAAQEPQEFIDSDQLISIIESLLFSTDKPVSIATIKQIFKNSNVRTKDITRAMDILASEYASSQRGVTLEEINGGYQLRTKSDNTEFLRRLAKVRPFRLSGPALEVLSIVAYKQPVSKHEIDEIRGVESGHLVRALMERSLMCFNGKSENLPGKPMTYGTTRKFLETFGLRNLKELPTLSEIDEILPEGIGEEVEKETLSDLTDRMSTELTSSYSEGEDELLQINAQLAQVDTTSEFFEQEKQRERDRRDRERAQDIRERIVVGDNVDEKDKKWLDRYEAKLLAQDQAAQAGVPVAIAAEEAAGVEPAIGEELSALSDEAQASAEAAQEASLADLGEDDEFALGADEEAFADSDSSQDDLTGNLDWDEDKD